MSVLQARNAPQIAKYSLPCSWGSIHTHTHTHTPCIMLSVYPAAWRRMGSPMSRKYWTTSCMGSCPQKSSGWCDFHTNNVDPRSLWYLLGQKHKLVRSNWASIDRAGLWSRVMPRKSTVVTSCVPLPVKIANIKPSVICLPSFELYWKRDE